MYDHLKEMAGASKVTLSEVIARSLGLSEDARAQEYEELDRRIAALEEMAQR